MKKGLKQTNFENSKPRTKVTFEIVSFDFKYFPNHLVMFQSTQVFLVLHDLERGFKILSKKMYYSYPLQLS